MLQKYLIALACVLGAVYAGIQIYNHFFTTKLTLDIKLAERTMKEIGMFEEKFGDHVVSLVPINFGEYKLDLQGIDNGQDAGRIGYNVLVVLDRENIKMNTPRKQFTIYGYQDDVMIFEIHYSTNNDPDIILHGPFEGVEYAPSFSKQNPVYTPDRIPGIDSSRALSRA
ncbi:MAG: hypothetical protein NTY09_11800 [bacterium]|nr:hypothetical protein [bacterium]